MGKSDELIPFLVLLLFLFSFPCFPSFIFIKRSFRVLSNAEEGREDKATAGCASSRAGGKDEDEKTGKDDGNQNHRPQFTFTIHKRNSIAIIPYLKKRNGEQESGEQ